MCFDLPAVLQLAHGPVDGGHSAEAGHAINVPGPKNSRRDSTGSLVERSWQGHKQASPGLLSGNCGWCHGWGHGD